MGFRGWSRISFKNQLIRCSQIRPQKNHGFIHKTNKKFQNNSFREAQALCGAQVKTFGFCKTFGFAKIKNGMFLKKTKNSMEFAMNKCVVLG